MLVLHGVCVIGKHPLAHIGAKGCEYREKAYVGIATDSKSTKMAG